VTVKFRVVVADDDADMRALLSTALRRDGRFEVVGEAGDGDEAVAVVEATQPDLVLLDLGMPGRGGLEALPLLRRAADKAQIVVVSGFPGDRLEAVSRASGAVGYVEKGLSPKQTVLDVLAVAGVLDAIVGFLSNRKTFDRDLASSRAARGFMAETLAQWDCGELLDSVNLLVSELVTNAVVHADSEAEVAVVLTSTSLRVEVADNGSGTVQPREAGAFDTSGRGMALVEAMSTRWGTEHRPDGGRVTWFEVERTGFTSRG
jgi:CheY-like chemotaxis protein/anti-sigma regulatory factor (Ser/Thr protein kinase)